jgi:hypothetical protein
MKVIWVMIPYSLVDKYKLFVVAFRLLLYGKSKGKIAPVLN